MSWRMDSLGDTHPMEVGEEDQAATCGNDMAKFLMDHLKTMIQDMTLGEVTITSHFENKDNRTVYVIQNANHPNPIIMLRFKREPVRVKSEATTAFEDQHPDTVRDRPWSLNCEPATAIKTEPGLETELDEQPLSANDVDESLSESNDAANPCRSRTVENHVPAGDKSFQCSHCEKKFSYSRTLQEHERLHTGENPYQCDRCERKFPASIYLQYHERVHKGERPSYDRNFVQLQSLKGGSAKNGSPSGKESRSKEKSYPCSACGKTFSRTCSFLRHLRHECVREEKSVRCQDGAAANSESSPTGGSETRAEGKPYRCCYCEKTFCKSRRLKEHERLHVGTEPYRCDQCGSEFRALQYLKAHREQIHKKEKSFQCSVCDKKFSQLTGLQRHECLRMGKKSYQGS